MWKLKNQCLFFYVWSLDLNFMFNFTPIQKYVLFHYFCDQQSLWIPLFDGYRFLLHEDICKTWLYRLDALIYHICQKVNSRMLNEDVQITCHIMYQDLSLIVFIGTKDKKRPFRDCRDFQHCVQNC